MFENHYGRKCVSILLQSEPCNDMIKIISDTLAQWYEMMNSFIITINFCNAQIMNSGAMMVNNRNHFSRKCIRNLLQLEPCNDILKVISDILEH